MARWRAWRIGSGLTALIAEQRRPTRVTLEPGGKSPDLILDGHDVGKPAGTIARFAPLMTGQVCSSLTRIDCRRPAAYSARAIGTV